MSWSIWRLTVLFTGLLTLALIAPRRVSAATLTVTALGDTGAPGQLRTLINAAASGDTIVIPAGTITLITISSPVFEDANTDGDLDIHKDLTIQGAGAGLTIIDSAGGDRVFDILAPATVTISGVTVRNGGFGEGGGGGIRNAGSLTLTNVTVSDNRAFGSPQVAGGSVDVTGGGILNTGTMTLTNVNVTGNTPSGIANTGTMTMTNGTVSGNTGAGGIDGNTGTLTMNNVTVTGNMAAVGSGIRNGGRLISLTTVTSIGGTLSLTNVIVSNNTGGGIFNFAGTATLTDVAISGNTTGGGICNCVGTMTLTNVTVSGNTASGPEGFSGGILNTGNMALTNVTVSGNMAQSGGGIANLVVIVSETADLSGGPVVRQFSAGTLTMTNATVTGNTPSGIFGSECSSSDGCGKSSARLKNTIVANNFPGGNCSGHSETITSLGHNLDSGSSCGFAGPGDLSNTDPQLGPLQNYGGPTQTHALLSGSPAVDAGDNAGCPATDQRGITRPQGVACDIGAYEFVPASAVRIPSLSGWGMLYLAGLFAVLLAVALLRRGSYTV